MRIAELIVTALLKIERQMHEPPSDLGATFTGFDKLDELIGGLHPGQFVIVAGRPATGKSALVTSIARHIAVHGGQPVALATERRELGRLPVRMLAGETSIPLARIRSGQVDTSEKLQLDEAAERISDAPLHVFTSDSKSDALVGAASIEGLAVLLADPLGALSHGQRTDSTDEMLRSVRRFAEDRRVAVVVTSGVRAQVEGRFNKRPWLSDLAALPLTEDLADVVVALYRDDIYDEGSPERGIMELRLLKNSTGPLTTVKAAFLHDLGVVRDLQRVRDFKLVR